MSSILVSLASSHDNTDHATVGFRGRRCRCGLGARHHGLLVADGAWLGKSGGADKIHEDGFTLLAELMSG